MRCSPPARRSPATIALTFSASRAFSAAAASPSVPGPPVPWRSIPVFPPSSAQARRELALHARRRGEHEEAAALWQEIAGDPEHGPQACEQLAIYYERRVRDYRRAAEFAQLAIANLRRFRSNALSNARATRLERSLQRRLARLQTRLAAEGRSREIFAQALDGRC